MKPQEVKRLAEAHDPATLDAAADALAEGQPCPVEVGGEDDGERLTHLMLAGRIHQRMKSEGEDLRTAYRAVMSMVRGVITNNPD